MRIAPGAEVRTAPVATSELYHVISGAGTTTVDDRTLAWSEGDVFVLPAHSDSVHRAEADATLYWVTDEPLLRYLGVAPDAAPASSPRTSRASGCAPSWPPSRRPPGPPDRKPPSPCCSTPAPNPMTQTVTHVLWAMVGTLPAGAVQRPHRHQSVALDLVGACEPGCYTLVGRTIDDRGEIVDPVRVDWEAGSAFVTPPGLWHAHHNESGARASIVPIQDAGLHTYLRSLDIRFGAPGLADPGPPTPARPTPAHQGAGDAARSRASTVGPGAAVGGCGP